MDRNIFSEPRFHDEEAARVWFEAARWPAGPICPHCKGSNHYATKKNGKLGRYRCANRECRKDFTVMTGTVMERSHVKLNEWAAAFHLAALFWSIAVVSFSRYRPIHSAHIEQAQR